MTRASAPIVLIAAAFLTVGCSAASVSTVSPEESQKTLFALLEKVQTRIGGDWVNEDSLSPRGCLLADGDEGVTFTGTRTLADPQITEDDIDALVAYLGDEGFEAGKSGIGLFTDVLAVDPNDKTSFVEVRIGDQSTQLTGQAACAVGNINDELERVKSEQ